ncbi:hypothetical protein [Engelhardtia mirabilis]|uniref:Uncharacterized protein n=1 Tax=Engelhardtia mirabilis TaxID=2528011 RepID=A0A518BSF8_9BACT|nr:hypothetical protein Pla133_50290 [Planctomycetes bacterium Pla133]QDV04232.1 hypothetical protein Pla86_50270 [Planctomycetes bacterium Pla86]
MSPLHLTAIVLATLALIGGGRQGAKPRPNAGPAEQPSAGQTPPAKGKPVPKAPAESEAAPPPADVAPNEIEALAAMHAQLVAAPAIDNLGEIELAWRTALERADNWMRAQPSNRLAPGPRVEFAWLRRWCQAEMARSERRRWRLDPSWHVERLEERIEPAPPRGAAVEVWQAYTVELDRIPAALLAAQEQLTRLRPEFTAHGASTARSLARALDPAIVDRASRSGLEGEALTALGEATRRGRRAAEAFARWLDEAEPRPIGEALIGPGGWQAQAQLAAGRSIELAELEVMLSGVIASGPRSHRPSAAAATVADAQLVVNTATRVGESVAAALELLELEGPEVSVGISYLDQPLGPALVGRPRSGAEWELALIPAGPSWPSEARDQRDRALAPGSIAAAALVFGSPGEGWLAKNGEVGREDLATFTDPLGIEGWGLFAARWLVKADREGGRIVSQAPLVDELGRLRREAAARTLASLQLHARGQRPEDVLATLRVHTGWDDWTARGELDAIRAEPRRGMGILHALELEALWDRWKATLGPEPALKRILRALQRFPRARASDLEAVFE